ncbi:MAG: DUF4160 domain-containing protein [Treponemataceae bacterium]|nr:DUF4160 domain-containing protein [Treponemataceae bacterium]
MFACESERCSASQVFYSCGGFHTPTQASRYVDFDGNILAGDFPPNKLKLVSAWTEIHKEELAALWELMQTSDDYLRIKGLD